MENIKKIIINEEIQKLVDKKEAKYVDWGQRRKEIVYTGKYFENIYWQHTSSHYHYLGKRDLTPRELTKKGF